MLADFNAWRICEMEKAPMESKEHNHASAYIRAINLAYERGYIAHNRAVPMLDSKGKSSQPCPAFSKEEITELLSHTETWVKIGFTERPRWC